MLLDSFYDAINLHRRDKVVLVKWDAPHRTLSTCPVNGGVREDLKAVFNHQMCEPKGHNRPELTASIDAPAQYLADLCRKYAIPEPCAAMATAVNMNCAAVQVESFQNALVVAVSTAGVESNAARAGDPAAYYEENGLFHSLAGPSPSRHGTVNSIVCTSKELTPSALTSAVMVAAEAKAAAFQELGLRSKYSDKMATGTGTDQIGICALLGSGPPLRSADKHSKIGELIGNAVRRSIRASVALQNGITDLSLQSLTHHLKPFVPEGAAVQEALLQGVEFAARPLLEQNFGALDRDPLVVAAVTAILSVRDRIRQGVFSAMSIGELISSFGAQLSAAASGKFDRVPAYRKRLPCDFNINNQAALVRFIGRCIAVGFSDKWT